MRLYRCTCGDRPHDHPALTHNAEFTNGKITLCTVCNEESKSLTPAADLIRRPGAWTQNAFAREGTLATYSNDPDTTCWCALGAISRVCHDVEHYHAVTAQLSVIIGTMDVDHWNDQRARTQEEVVAALEAAELEVNGGIK